MSRTTSENTRREFPFPRMERSRTSSSAGSSLPSRSDSSQSKSIRTPSSSGSPNSLPRARLEHDLQHEGVLPGVSSKLLSRLSPRDHHDTRTLRTLLAVTTERLDSETRRADDAERRVLEVLRKLRAAHEATMLAQAEATRAKEELVLYRYRLEDAQREILRAQEILNELEQQKLEAEAEAARARSTARRYREQQLIARAREEGREVGLQEALSRGKIMGYQEATSHDDARTMRYGERTIENVPEEEEEEPPPRQHRSQTPGPTDARAPGPEFRRGTPGPGPSFVQSGRVTPTHVRRPPSHASRVSQGTRVPGVQYDTAHHAATLPVPTLVTPDNLPSPSHSRADTPNGIPTAHPASQSLDEGEMARPIPILRPIPSPSHPPVAIPPDGWIPYADGNEGIHIPPPHELSRPVSPISPTPPPPPILHFSDPPQHSASTAPPEPDLRTRDRALPAGIPPEGIPVVRSNASRTMSPQSKASTSISQYDLVGAPAKGELRVSTQRRSAKEDRQVMSPRGPRPREVLQAPVGPPMERLDSSSKLVDRGRSPTSPLERLFKKRYRDKSSRESHQPPAIPNIIVESPSTHSTSRSSVKTTITQPHLLSPEPTAQPLAPVESDIIVMQTEIPGYYPSIAQGQFRPSLTEANDDPVIPPPPGGQFPLGFIPLTPPMPTDTLSENPVPVPSNTPIPVPPPSNPIYVRPPSRSIYVPPPGKPMYVPPPGKPIPVPAPSNTPVPIPPGNPRDPIPIAHDEPLPIPHDEPLPVPQRSPRQARYDEAPIPAGVMYPDRSSTPSGLLRANRGLVDVRSPGERLSPLPLQFQFFAPLRSDTTTSEL